MGILSRLFGQKPKAYADLVGPGTFSVDVVGESHYQDNLEAICGRRTEAGVDGTVTANLILEDWNPHDNLAVRIDIEGKTVGYMRREFARQFRQRLKEAGLSKIKDLRCQANIRGGWKRKKSVGSYGVWLDLPVDGEPD